MSPPGPTPSTDRTEEFIRLLTEHDRTFTIYVVGLVGSRQDGQDILQEGKVVMWKAFEQFQSGTNFQAWGRRILFHQILEYRRKQKKVVSYLGTTTLELLDQIAESAIREERWVARERALDECVRRLSADHQKMLSLRYQDETSIDRISQVTKRSVGAVYRVLSRIRKNLYDCIEMNIARQSGTAR